ncbi:GlxA family transcriptional regulator [Streptomyces shenzhenensis]|uniref:GlxA family transcriptional regulator n=1 Tax=Streptomyces shenzhenensis TaxID=943815 RepID=UPI00381D9A6E
MYSLVVLALDEAVAFDVTAPIEVFRRTRLPDGHAAYRVRVCAPGRSVRMEGFRLETEWGLEALEDADTVMVPGRLEGAGALPGEVLEALRRAAAAGTRIASVCTGAFVLAEAGLLDGLRATTHWIAADLLARQYPKVRVEPDVLYVDNGQILTSAGAAASLDLCLHMIRQDLGSAVAADAARLSVMPLEREGGQAQFITHQLPPLPSGSALEPLLAWLESNLASDVKLEDMAARAGMSGRTFSRRFQEQTGTTPLQWLLRARVRRAQFLLENSEYGIERVASLAGFGSPTTFRDRFRRVVGTSPKAYRTAFRANSVTSATM